MHKVYNDRLAVGQEQSAMNESDEQCENIIIVILNYTLYCGAHLLGISYYYTYILYEDAQRNDKYENKDITSDYVDSNLIAVSIACFIILYGQQICLSLKYTRHILGVCLSMQFYTLLYIYSNIRAMLNTNCKNRQFLTCYKNTTQIELDDSVLDEYSDITLFAICSVVVIQLTYVVGSMVRNKKQGIYYFSKTPCKEFTIYFIYYLGVALATAIAPLIIIVMCVTGGGGGGGGDGGGCNMCQGCNGTILGNNVESDHTQQTAPFGSTPVSHYNRGHHQGDENV